ncbi:bifunctional D-glycero-beta-D-manno-heptose-7-phosphate kinase/D-glycero-beta-D-manno-heptose 1-phosphate adenylyltransferase HldE [Thiotrichales bacterium 19S11-10]|nr:bifunctional D-glycero-beta-D-manno-heptose-7-phosphate kinase/D-glycero-beta-D-manno-heptose 1-phosphate adenylyltransferase HldE [Thiotrichales bacterium 19S11-10]MCF6807218.1 bifunctional D-glycero-beta-D-manno-heptose-7-phosphate kinase/D-glycero-beta-D-manno-heptose 1-phosphate adenylyltransferase HldE [Thiotrichales bacterium 19S9-11]MCF6811187.1 bifunctional D-glycero-beta-D-manno-heptose-7-phosphate kinase/D-glycero-beta-D-manno-heptose 1-phosphate adenylyltransferase HldE [Thiotrichal
MSLSLKNASVLVVGDVMLDRYWEGKVKRISPEAPVPVVHVGHVEQCAGGAGNVALNITALMGKAYLCGCIGDDEAGDTLKNALTDAGVQVHFTKTKLPTITKLRVISQQQQLLRLDFEEGFHGIDKSALVNEVEMQIKNVDAVILSDYAKGTLSDPRSLIQIAKKHKTPVLVDPKGKDFEPYRGATMITPNMKEFEAVVGACKDENDIRLKALALIKTLDIEAMLITRSEKGMMLVHKTGIAYNIPTKAKEVFDVTGAGDTVISVMGMALAQGIDYQEAIQLANTAAGVVVGKLGTATLSLEELYHALNESAQILSGALTEEEVKQAMKQAHLQGERIVFTNGCFDILHKGHVDYLKEAKALGDRLVIGVNTDASVTKLKGPSRPIVPLKDRMELLSSLECVDWVVAFDEETPKRLIATLLPDILVKGADYEIKDIAGAQEVLDNGGEVKTITLTEGRSTTTIIQKIQSLDE